MPARNVHELIAYASENPRKLTFSSSGIGNPQQLTGELFNKMAGVQIMHVPYKGAAPQKMPELVTRLRNLGFEPLPNTPEQFRDFIRNESAKFAKIIVDANVKLEQ